MSDHPCIYIKSSFSLADAVSEIVNLLLPSRVAKAGDERFYLDFGWYRVVVGDNPFPRRDALPQDWYPPFDSYTYQMRIDLFRDREMEMDVARGIFEAMKSRDIWSMALSWESQTVLDRYYPATSEGAEARRIDEEEAAILPIPTRDREIFLQSTEDFDILVPELGMIFGSGWSESKIIDNLTHETTRFFSFSDANVSLSLNENYSNTSPIAIYKNPSDGYRYKFSVRDFRGPAVQFADARVIFDLLKNIGRWDLLFVEDGFKVLDSFDASARIPS